MGVEFDADVTADLTASWVVSGPTAATFREDIKQAIASKADAVRETIQEGVEHGVSLPIPVVDGNAYGALRRVVDRKGFAALGPDDRRRIVRLATATLGTESGRCSPYALVEALLTVASARSPTETLTTGDVAYGLARLPAARLCPSLPATMRKALKTLLVADEPLGRSAIIERAGISEASYDRNIDELAAIGMVESVGNGGHKKWQAWILPWWSPLADIDTPRTTDSDENVVSRPSRWDDVLYDVALDLGLDPEYELFAGSVDADEVFATLPLLDLAWFFEAHYGLSAASTTVAADSDSDSDRQSAGGPLDTNHAVEIGSLPADWDRKQKSLDHTE